MPAPSDSVKAEGSVKRYTSMNPSNGNIGKWTYPTSIPSRVILDLVSRLFCENCGAHLISQQSGNPERVFVRAGIIDAFTKMPVVLESECANVR